MSLEDLMHSVRELFMSEKHKIVREVEKEVLEKHKHAMDVMVRKGLIEGDKELQERYKSRARRYN